MSDLHIRIEGNAGCITLNRPEALNAMTYDQCLAIEAALDDWNDRVDLVILDAVGERAFCAGGDIADLYEASKTGDPSYSRQFWRDEYRLNAKIAAYPRPIVTFLQGFTMGGGVGLGCHASHRIVGDSSRIAMPECSIGLVPDIGGSWILANAPGHLGRYLAVTGDRMGPADAIYAGFADHFLPEDRWDGLKEKLKSGLSPDAISEESLAPEGGRLMALRATIDALFDTTSLQVVSERLRSTDAEIAFQASRAMSRNAPLAMAATLRILERMADASGIEDALDQEFRYTSRAVEQGDFIEGIRALIIDKDKAPKWAYHTAADVPSAKVEEMLAPLPDNVQNWRD